MPMGGVILYPYPGLKTVEPAIYLKVVNLKGHSMKDKGSLMIGGLK